VTVVFWSPTSTTHADASPYPKEVHTDSYVTVGEGGHEYSTPAFVCDVCRVFCEEEEEGGGIRYLEHHDAREPHLADQHVEHLAHFAPIEEISHDQDCHVLREVPLLRRGCEAKLVDERVLPDRVQVVQHHPHRVALAPIPGGGTRARGKEIN
jgi:hypothetical protein